MHTFPDGSHATMGVSDSQVRTPAAAHPFAGNELYPHTLSCENGVPRHRWRCRCLAGEPRPTARCAPKGRTRCADDPFLFTTLDHHVKWGTTTQMAVVLPYLRTVCCNRRHHAQVTYGTQPPWKASTRAAPPVPYTVQPRQAVSTSLAAVPSTGMGPGGDWYANTSSNVNPARGESL